MVEQLDAIRRAADTQVMISNAIQLSTEALATTLKDIHDEAETHTEHLRGMGQPIESIDSMLQDHQTHSSHMTVQEHVDLRVTVRCLRDENKDLKEQLATEKSKRELAESDFEHQTRKVIDREHQINSLRQIVSGQSNLSRPGRVDESAQHEEGSPSGPHRTTSSFPSSSQRSTTATFVGLREDSAQQSEAQRIFDAQPGASVASLRGSARDQEGSGSLSQVSLTAAFHVSR